MLRKFWICIVYGLVSKQTRRRLKFSSMRIHIQTLKRTINQILGFKEMRTGLIYFDDSLIFGRKRA